MKARWWRLPRLLGMAIILLSTLAACTLHRDARDLRVTIAAPVVPATLDPHVDAGAFAETRFLHAALYDSLTRIDENGELQPGLALSWKPLGPTSWEFDLREGVKFQDGEEITAQTVVYNVRRILRADLRSPVAADIGSLYRANAAATRTVVISTRVPDPILPRRLAAFYLLPQGYTDKVGDTRIGQEPQGTGPWRVVQFTPGVSLRLEAMKGSWRGAPQVRFIDVRQVADASARVRALVAGEVDIALDVPAATRAELAGNGIAVQETPISAARLIMLDTTVEGSPLANDKVRQALNYAVDKEALIARGPVVGIPLAGRVVGREANGYSGEVMFDYPFDLNRARQLISEAGFADGFELVINYTNNPDDLERREVEAIASYLAQIKVRVVPKGADRAVHLERRRVGALTPAFYETFRYYPTEDASLVMDWFGLERTATLSPTYDVEEFDEIYKLSRLEQNQSLRSQALRVSMGILAQYPGAIYLYQPVRLNAARARITGLRMLPSLLIDLERVGRR